MYTFTDRGDRSLTLRPEGTAPIARAYLEHGLHREPQPVKLFTIAPMYRYGRPGRGRYREHWQLSLEAIGSPGPEIDAEVIQFYAALLGRLGVTEWELHLNSIGDAACRPAYVERLNAWLDAHPELASEEVGHKRATSPLQVFDVKDERLREALDDAPKIGDSLCDACQEHFDAVRGYLDAVGVPYVSTRCSCGASTTTRAPRSSSSGRRRTSTRRSAAAAATTVWSRRSAGRRRRASASAPGSSGSCSRSSARRPSSPSAPAIDVFFASTAGRASGCSP